MRLIAAVLLATVLSLPSPARAADAPAWRLDVILDTRADGEQRSAQIGALRSDADAGTQAARCALGRIGLLAAQRPREYPATDYGDAVGYLNACVLGGDFDAMLLLAEHELAQRRPLEAMIWTQAYIKVASFFGPEEVNAAGSYKVGLIQRIERTYGGRRPSNEEVLEYVAGLLDAHGERIVGGCERGGCSWLREALPPSHGPLQSAGGGRTLLGRFARDSSRAEDDAAYASFLLVIDERGRVTAAHPLELVPDARAAMKLVGTARNARFNQIPDGSGPRYAVLPVYVDNPDLKLVPDAAPNTRNRVRG